MHHSTASLLLTLVLGGCATAPDCPTSPPTTAPALAPALAPEPATARVTPSLVVFVRHAEKASDGTADPPLTERGLRRAACLATLLGPFEPDRLITSEYQRTRDTLAPLASVTGLTPTVIPAADLDTWTSTLRTLPPGSRVVISGHSNTIPAWVAALGEPLEDLDAEGNIGHDDYERMIEVVLDDQGHAMARATFSYCTEPAS